MKLAILLSLGMSLSFGESRAKVPDNGAFAGETHAKRPPAIAVTQAMVEGWTRMWQQRLSLDDWEISTQIVRAYELRPETLGNLRWNSETKTATIRVLDPRDYDLQAAEIPTDIEYTVLHELIHLQLSALPRDLANKAVEEKVVNRLAEALFALEKGPNYRPRTSVQHLQAKNRAASEASRTVQH